MNVKDYTFFEINRRKENNYFMFAADGEMTFDGLELRIEKKKSSRTILKISCINGRLSG
jgi:hypothetical protein